MYFIVEYNRAGGELCNIRTYDTTDVARAQDDRLRVEIDHLRAGRDIEVVLLEAANEQSLRMTHRRYFEGLRDLTTKPSTTSSSS